MKLFIGALKKLNSLKYLFPILLLFFVSSSLFDQYLMKKLENTLKGSENTTIELFLYGGLNLLNSLFFPLLISLLTIFFIINPTKLFFTSITQAHIESIIIETLRSWGKMIWWGFLFIIPGFYKYLCYSYVPFVVLMDTEYDHGKVDALKESERIFKKRFMASLITLVLFQLVLPILLSSLLDSYRSFKETPFLAFLSSLLQGVIGLLGLLILMEIFTQEKKETLAK